MGNPQQDMPAVHIAGTNGKGSTALIISSVLSQAGYRVGQFMSPHVHSYRERFTIDGVQIAGDSLEYYLNLIEENIKMLQARGCERPTEFEILTALAFQYFLDSRVDVAVLEVGMGGLYDSTNVVQPLVSVITSIDYDHMSFLGNSLEEIAINKAGIIKSGIPVVVGPVPPAALKVIAAKANQESAPLLHSSRARVERRGKSNTHMQVVDISLAGYSLTNVGYSLLGDYQLTNLAASLVALMVLKERGYAITDQVIVSTLSNLSIPGRLEVVNQNPLVIIDAAHNPHAARALADSLPSLIVQREKVLICGIVDDKDAYHTLKALGQGTRTCVVTRPEGPRGQGWQRIAEIWKTLYPDKKIYLEENIVAAVEKGISLLQPEEYLLVAGSFYILDKARSYFTRP